MSSDSNHVDSTEPASTALLNPVSAQQQQQPFQGVLYKRRDVFQKRWRPRWFVLQPHSGVLTYYLLAETFSSDGTTSRTDPQAAATTPQRSQRTRSVVLERHTPQVMTANGNPSTSPTDNSMDYDVVPRGTIYLPECRVQRDDDLSQNGWFVFTIRPPPDGSSSSESSSQQQLEVYLSATSEQSRNEWMEQLSTVCGHALEDEDDSEEHTASTIVDEEDQEDDDGGSYAGTTWKDADDSSKLEGVPDTLADRIELTVRKFLPLCRENDSSSASSLHGDEGREETAWKKTLDIPNGITFYKRKHQGHAMIKTVGVLRHHPKQLFNLLADIHRRREFEKNVREDERLQTFNSHTFLDYYAYRAVWPTTARDFAVVVHWRVLEERSSGRRAICIMGFSDPAADALRPPVSGHVRANLLITMTLLQLVDSNRCHLTRILSYDLGGNVPKSLTNTILQQQASMPVVLTQYLTTAEPEPEERLATGDLTSESLITDVIGKLPKATKPESLEGSVKRRLKFDDEVDEGVTDSPTKAAQEQTEISILLSAVLLLTPLILWHFAQVVHLPGREIYFCVAVVLAVRAVVLGHLGRCIERNDSPESTMERVTCHFTVDLKGVLRFIANRKEEQEEEKIQSPEVSIIHIILRAMAKALNDVEALKSRHVSIPILGIDGHYLPRGGQVDVSLLLASHNEPQRPEDVATLHDVGAMSVQQIVDRVEEEKCRLSRNDDKQAMSVLAVIWDTLCLLVRSLNFLDNRRVGHPSLGNCVVVACPDSDLAQVDMDATISAMHADDVNVVVVVGGVRLHKEAYFQQRTPPGSNVSVIAAGSNKPTMPLPPPGTIITSKNGNKKPHLVLSMTMQCPHCSVAACRQFAERVQNLVQFPEICEES